MRGAGDFTRVLRQYGDDGCEESPPERGGCLQCPLPTCRFDSAGRLFRSRREARDREIIRGRFTSTVPQLADRFKVSERTAYRILARGRAA